ncbi:MAG: hypothetical protein GYA24_24410 [Candidatus Lokiarchaeota archaeon]|nr:hypothetical protein [Candidatus Lokiarchaeota archaeon]
MNKKFLAFAAFLAASIALVMIGGIWFGSTWIPSPWFWLIVVGSLAASMLSLIVWKIDFAYTGVELEPGDLADEDESEMKKGVQKPAARPAGAVIAKAKQPMKVTGAVQKPVGKQPPTMQKDKATAPATSTGPTPATKAAPFVPGTAVMAPSKPARPPADAGKGSTLADQLASIPAKEASTTATVVPAKDEHPSSSPAVKVKLNRKNVQGLITIYNEEGYHSVSFSKFRNDLGVGKDKEILKLKKLLLEAVAMGFLAKKGSRYIIQREGQAPLE